MNWLKYASSIHISQISQHLEMAIDMLVPGTWKMIQDNRMLWGRYLQYNHLNSFYGINVRTKNDKYFVKINTLIRINKKPKADNMEQEDGYTWEQVEEWHKKNNPIVEVTHVDTDRGHGLLTFQGYIEGWTPGMTPENEFIFNADEPSQFNNFPGVRPEGIPQMGMQRFGEFKDLKTPRDVALHIRNAIQKFNPEGGGGFGGNDGNPSTDPTPNPSTYQPVLV